jgi:YMGG-like Gly-zipper
MSNRLLARLCALALLLSAIPLIAQTGMGYGKNYIPEDTRFIIRLDDNLDASKLEPGKRFKAKLAEDLVAPDGQTIQRGAKIKGHVSTVDRGLHGHILLSFDEIQTRHGWMPLIASVNDVPGEHSMKTSNEGEIENKGTPKRRMIETAAVGAGIGAAAGAAAGGGKGAAIGAGAGAAAGGLGGMLLNRNLKLLKGQQLELRLDRPLEVPSR